MINVLGFKYSKERYDSDDLIDMLMETKRH